LSEAKAQRELARISAIRLQMLQIHPFWGYLLMQVQLVPAPELDTLAATDCIRHIWFNPSRTAALTLSELGFVLAHEACHHLLASLGRQRGRNQLLWNCATDHAINHMVCQMRHPANRGEILYRPPRGALLEDRFRGKIAETIYEYLRREQAPKTRNITVVLDAHGGDGRTIQVPNVTDHGGGIDVHLPVELSPEQLREMVRRANGALKAHNSSRLPGHVPRSLLRRILGGHHHQVPWQRVLQRLASQHLAKDDYSLARPNRRYLEHDLVVPGLCGEQVAEMVIALDTSGSMAPEELKVVAAELEAIIPLAREVTLLAADSTVREVLKGEEVLARMRGSGFRGGGGTDHRPVFAWIDQQRKRPDLFVGLTDLRSHFPARKPPYPVLWVVPRQHGEAPWGQVLELN